MGCVDTLCWLSDPAHSSPSPLRIDFDLGAYCCMPAHGKPVHLSCVFKQLMIDSI